MQKFLARDFSEEILKNFPIGKLAISALWFDRPKNSSNLNARNRDLNNDNRAFGMTFSRGL